MRRSGVSERENHLKTLGAVGTEFCENSSIHGFSYWINSGGKTLSPSHRVLWFVITLLSFIGSIVVLKDIIYQWETSPTVVTIETFSLPATSLPYPAISVCKPEPYDVGEYIRAVFDNFQMTCDAVHNACSKTTLLRNHYPGIFEKHYVSSHAETLVYDLLRWADARNLDHYLSIDNFNDSLSSLVPFYFSHPGDLNLADPSLVYQLLYTYSANIDGSLDWNTYAGVEFKPSMIKATRREMAVMMNLRGCWRRFAARYQMLCNLAWRNPLFWEKLAKCHIQRSKESNVTVDLRTKSPNYNQSCLEEQELLLKKAFNHKPDADTLTTFSLLTHFDVHLIGEAILTQGTFNWDIMTFAFSTGVLAQTPKFNNALKSYCGIEGRRNCSYSAMLKNLAHTLIRMKFLQQYDCAYTHYNFQNLVTGRIRLPEEDFGKILSNLPVRSYAEITVFSGWGKDHMGLALFKNYKATHLNLTDDVYTLFSHPLFLADVFSSHPLYTVNEYGNVTIDELVKVLMFGTYIKAKADLASNTTVDSLVQVEAKKYPYTRKASYKPPYFTGMDLSSTPMEFSAGLTDAGICSVYNGNSIFSTFMDGERTTDLRKALDPRKSVDPKNVEGTGKVYAHTMWLNLAERSLKSHLPTFPAERRSTLISLNEFGDFFNVRWNNFEVSGGQDVVVEIEPEEHAATQAFKGLDPATRKCLLPTEARAESMFKHYSEKGCQFECRLKYAIGVTNCLPWNYPQPMGLNRTQLPICTATWNGENFVRQFEDALGKIEALKSCNCLPDCQHISYKKKVNTMELDTKKLCNFYGDWSTIDLVMSDWQKTHSPLVHWSKEISPKNYRERYKTLEISPMDLSSTNISYGLPTTEMLRICEQRYRNDVARITFVVSDPNVMQIMRNVRVTFPDQIAAVGGTLGLFAGASLISLVEVVFWIYRAILQILGGERAHKK